VIRIIKGPEEGQRFECSGAESVVGRSPRSQVRLASPTASYEHAVITRNGEDFFIENLSAAGTYVNEERISGKVRLRSRDQLRFGAETVARVESVPTSGTASGRRRGLLIAFVLMLVVVVILMLFDPFSTPPQRLNYRAAYAKLETWTHEEVQSRVLPIEAEALLREAWRLEMSGDKSRANTLWVKLNVLLDGIEERTGFQSAAQRDPLALQHLANPPHTEPAPPAPTEEEMGAALVQFVSRMARSR
jgi:pSer/pThr/pTyr-binding forkhead associated (FHA) protein